MDFDADIALQPGANEALHGEIVEGWETPRGPLGGYVMAIVVNGMMQAVGDPARQARSITVHFLRPPHAGPVVVHPVIERAGRSLTTVSARMEQDGKLIALAVGAFSVAWESPLLDDAPMPSVGEPDLSRPSIGPLPDRPKAPVFTGRLTMQWRFGDPPFSGSDHGEVGGWLGLRQDRPLDAPAVALLTDAWFPAPWPRLTDMAPAPTIDLTVHFRSPLPLEDSLLLGRFRSRLVSDGFFDEDGELWSADGTLVAQSRQLGLLIGAQV